VLGMLLLLSPLLPLVSLVLLVLDFLFLLCLPLLPLLPPPVLLHLVFGKVCCYRPDHGAPHRAQD